MSQDLDVDLLTKVAKANKRPDYWPDLVAAMDFAEKYPATFLALLDAARAEGVAALQQAGEPVAWRWQQVEIEAGREWVTTEYDDDPPAPHLEYVREVTPLYASPIPQQTALVEQGVEKIIGPHEPPQQPVAVSREEIAREIDPEAWERLDRRIARNKQWSPSERALCSSADCNISLAKADAILAKMGR